MKHLLKIKFRMTMIWTVWKNLSKNIKATAEEAQKKLNWKNQLELIKMVAEEKGNTSKM